MKQEDQEYGAIRLRQGGVDPHPEQAGPLEK